MKATLLPLLLLWCGASAQPTAPCYSCSYSDRPDVLLARAKANYATECFTEAAACFYHYQRTSELDSASLYHFVVSQAFSMNRFVNVRNGVHLSSEDALLHDALLLKRKYKSCRGIYFATAYEAGRLYSGRVTRDPRLDLKIVSDLEEILKHWECEGYDCGTAEFKAQVQKLIDDCAARRAYETKRLERLMRNKGQDSLVTYPRSGGF